MTIFYKIMKLSFLQKIEQFHYVKIRLNKNVAVKTENCPRNVRVNVSR